MYSLYQPEAYTFKLNIIIIFLNDSFIYFDFDQTKQNNELKTKA